MLDTITHLTLRTLEERGIIIDARIRAILKAKRPKTYWLIRTINRSWFLKLMGIDLRFVRPHAGYEEYTVCQFGNPLGSFAVTFGEDIDIT